jgi:transcription termination factor Rho
MYKLEELNTAKVSELKEIAIKLNISNYEKLKKLDLAYAILDFQAEHNEAIKSSDDKKTQDSNSKPKAIKKIVAKKEKKPQHLNQKKEEDLKNQKIKIVQEKTNNTAKSNTDKSNNTPHQKTNNNHSSNYKGNKPERPNPNSKPKSDYDYDFSGIIETEGVIEIMPDGYGFMRSSD